MLHFNYQHEAFDESDSFTSSKPTFRALNTPSHSPNPISIVLSREGQDVAVLTGNVSRPDLCEAAGNMESSSCSSGVHAVRHFHRFAWITVGTHHRRLSAGSKSA